MDLSLALRMPTEKRQPLNVLSRSRTPNIFMPSSDTAYSSRMAEMCRKLRLSTGPLNGRPRPLGRIILADDPVAADATCARLMGLDPDKVAHIRAGAQFLGNSSCERIDQFGEPVRP